jgi:hypothetical protein
MDVRRLRPPILTDFDTNRETCIKRDTNSMERAARRSHGLPYRPQMINIRAMEWEMKLRSGILSDLYDYAITTGTGACRWSSRKARFRVGKWRGQPIEWSNTLPSTFK